MTDLALQPGEPHRVLQAERLDDAAHDLYERTGENLYKRLMRTGRNYGTIKLPSDLSPDRLWLFPAQAQSVTLRLLAISAIFSASHEFAPDKGEAQVSWVKQC